MHCWLSCLFGISSALLKAAQNVKSSCIAHLQGSKKGFGTHMQGAYHMYACMVTFVDPFLFELALQQNEGPPPPDLPVLTGTVHTGAALVCTGMVCTGMVHAWRSSSGVLLRQKRRSLLRSSSHACLITRMPMECPEPDPYVPLAAS